MDTQIIVAIISGLCGSVISPLMLQVVIPALKGPGTHSLPVSNARGSAATFLEAGVGGVIGMLVGYFLLSPFFVSSCPPFAATRVDIASPVAGDRVSRLVTVQGTTCHIPNDKELWLLVVPEGTTGYYPQTGPVVISSDGNWSASAYAGLDDPVDVGRGFVLIASLADRQGSAAIRAYFAQSSTAFKGLEPLPQGVQLLTQVRVLRK